MSESERDRDVAAAWRDASREEPPPAVDDAVRAQARRTVGAAPEARRRHREWRYPAAAAATVAVLAFGIAHMTSRDAIEPILVANQAARQPSTAAPAPMREQSPPATQAPDSRAAAEVARSPKTTADAEVASAPTASAAARDPAPPPVKSAPVRKDEEASNGRFAAPPPSAGVQASDGPSATAGSPAPTSAPDGAARETASDTRSRDVFAQAPQRPSPAAPVAEPRRAAAAPMAVAKVTNLDEAKAKQAGAESVEAWIARIRDLKSRGESEAAAKELAKFRETYADRAEALLPEDLRAK
jgi:hypothetical protein